MKEKSSAISMERWVNVNTEKDVNLDTNHGRKKAEKMRYVYGLKRKEIVDLEKNSDTYTVKDVTSFGRQGIARKDIKDDTRQKTFATNMKKDQDAGMQPYKKK